jgi:hypothetical protein
MYEQYTDKQIVEMLVPKLEKLCPYYDWNNYLNSEGYEAWLHFVATLYKSGYIRGQLGRSFIIGQPKRAERWVPTTKYNVKVGSKVKMINEECHRNNPWCFPDIGTLGIVTELSYNKCKVQWPEGITIKPDRWWCNYERLEVLLCE